MRIFLLRHGQTLWSLSGQHTGKTDIDLTDVGIGEARAIAPLVRRLTNGREFDAVYTSPRRRALRTAHLALGREDESRTEERPTPPPIVTDLLAEFDYGDYEGLTAEQIRQREPGWDFWTGDCPTGETMAAVASRADRFIAMLREQHGGEHVQHANPAEPTILAVSHGHMIRILAARLLGLEGRQGRIFDIKTASLAEFREKEGRFVVVRWNCTRDL